MNTIVVENRINAGVGWLGIRAETITTKLESNKRLSKRETGEGQRREGSGRQLVGFLNPRSSDWEGKGKDFPEFLRIR